MILVAANQFQERSVMAKPYPIESRTRVIQLYKSGEYTVRSLSKSVSLGVATVNRWLSRFHKSGEIMPKQ